ncbi:oligosaccharide flippase family protein [Larsenimonas rhizosphaerae]|uniref:Oligosaccharide flippase family protein n=1 Tax=Larsenimonas rhizosphaerae TaxID=2944682 RepID=A0AA41ZFF0_9GAMM|nr:oligosaccharide flippase family protein [Larsenimonas rhizosphaerae]MCX2523169.1 oligosaccharide flippase family protein [Larsenimonas rhizosphaerae]
MKAGGLAGNVSWTFLATIVNSIVQIVQLGIVGHYVAVSDMGLLSVVVAIVNIGIIFQDVGFSSFLIYKQDIKDRQRHLLFSLNILLGILLFGLSIASSGFIEDLINKPGFAALFCVGALNFLALGLGSQAQALMIKSKALNTMAQFDMSAKFLGLGVTVALLFVGYGIYSQLLGMIAANLFMSLLCFFKVNKSYPIRFYFGRDCLTDLKEPLAFGSYHLGSVLIGEFRKQFDVFLAARFLPAHTLGLYTVGKELALRSMMIIRPVIQKVVMPIFAEQQSTPDKLRKSYLTTLYGITAAFGIPAAIGMIFSGFFLSVIYGDKYIEADQFFSIFILIAYLRCLGLPTGVLAQAMGKTNIEFYWNIISTIVLCAVLVLTVFVGVGYFAFAILAVQVVLTIMQRRLFLNRLINVGLFQYTISWLAGFIALSLVYFFWVGF